MRYFKHIAKALCMTALGVMALTGCEGADQYGIDSPDWIKDKIDSINNSKQSHEEVLEGMQEDVYTIGKTDFSTGWWAEFSKYYVIGENQKWYAQFNLNLNPDDNTYFKNFAVVITNDCDRGATDYKEYGAIRFDATGDSATYNSQWGSDYYKLPFKFTTSTQLLSPEDNKDANMQKLGGKVTLTVDRSRKDSFVVKMTNGAVTKTYTQPYALKNMNPDASDTNIRCFLVPEGSYIDFLSTNIVPIGGLTSAEDKQPLSMTLNNVPDEVDLGTSLDDAMQNVSAEVTYEEGVKKTIPASELYFSAINDMNVAGEKTLTVIYNKTFKGEASAKPIVAYATFKVVQQIASIKITKQPTRTTYYFYKSAATEAMGDRTMAFDPTGMEVTATYKNGETGVLDNSKLKFSAVAASAGKKAVTISTANGKEAKTMVTVKESASSAAAFSPSLVGLKDNTTAWWTAFSDDVKVPAGETRSFSFTNYTDGLSNWYNFLTILRNADKGEYGVVRADNYGWGNGYAACQHDGTAGADWASWLAAMNGAKVTVYVTNCNNGTADVQAIMKGTDGKTYTQYYLGLNTVDPADLYVAFTADHCHLVAGTSGAKRHVHRR
ncbi:bacterial Ig-like domain-containing protein [Hallella absiana]|uniref:bacterial Ig-like domain-containing protein n=1 Tax=Hallella absiana TaxID=2925336 RepID=UPI0021C915CE|nr:bacterial Ig-like domain-containing protein [Hallella absiana]